jgi:hypothetical protein
MDVLNLMSKSTTESQSDKDYLAAADAAAGDLDNEKVRFCYTCKNKGYPHEAITLEKVNGRVLSDGKNEVVEWKLKDYFTGRHHQHKQQQQQYGEERHYLGRDLEAFD